MKRFVCLLLLGILLLFNCSASADAWEVGYFVDDFGDKTDSWYLQTSTIGVHNYNNKLSGIKSFVVVSDTTAYITLTNVVDYQRLGSKIINTSSMAKEYEVLTKTSDGKTHSFPAKLASQSDRIQIANADTIRFTKMIISSAKTDFVIKPKGSSIEKYTFTLERSNFLEVLPAGSSFDDRRFAFIDKTGKIIGVCDRWDNVCEPSEGLARVKKAEKWGFVDTTGQLVIPCQWDLALDFSEGLAAVKRNEKFGFINTNGELVIPCEWEININDSFHEGLMCVRQDGKYGFINKAGELVIPFEYSEQSGKSFSEGLLAVKCDNKFGYIDSTGKLVIPCKWNKALSFQEGLAAVAQDNGKMGYIDTSGKLVIPCEWKYTFGFSEGMAMVADDNYKIGYIDQNGNLVIPCEYELSFSDFSDGLVKVQQNKKYGFVDKTGELVIPCVWETDYRFIGDSNGTGFSDGLAYVVRNNKGGYINREGELVIPCVWDMGCAFKDGVALVFGSIE